MPNRIIRDGWNDSEKIDALAADEECFFLRLCLKADDYGRFTANLKLLKAALYPLKDDVRDTDISRKLAAVEQAGLVRCYEVDNKRYVEIVAFNQQQRSKSKCPDPPWIDKCAAIANHTHSKRTATAHSVGGVVVAEGEVPLPPGGRARGVEIPDRQQAIDRSAISGVDPAFAGHVYDDWSGRCGKDGAGIDREWLQYVTTRWNRERKEWMDGNHRGKSHGSNRTNSKPDRNEGLYRRDDAGAGTTKPKPGSLAAAAKQAAIDAMAKEMGGHGGQSH